jgi:hypothetical protein
MSALAQCANARHLPVSSGIRLAHLHSDMEGMLRDWLLVERSKSNRTGGNMLSRSAPPGRAGCKTLLFGTMI